jgi:hypothetical protein
MVNNNNGGSLAGISSHMKERTPIIENEYQEDNQY